MAPRLKLLNNSNGFSILEVMIAMALFAVFVTTFMYSQSSNIRTSEIMKSDINLHTLCERILNERVLDPPKFTNILHKEVDKGAFKEEGFKHFKYEVRYSKIEIPDLAAISGQEDDGEVNPMWNTIFKNIKENIEKALWQITVTVINSETSESYELSTWVTNDEHEIKIKI